MKKVKHLFATITFQIAVNIIGLPVYHTLKTDRIAKTLSIGGSNFF